MSNVQFVSSLESCLALGAHSLKHLIECPQLDLGVTIDLTPTEDPEEQMFDLTRDDCFTLTQSSDLDKIREELYAQFSQIGLKPLNLVGNVRLEEYFGQQILGLDEFKLEIQKTDKDGHKISETLVVTDVVDTKNKTFLGQINVGKGKITNVTLGIDHDGVFNSNSFPYSLFFIADGTKVYGYMKVAIQKASDAFGKQSNLISYVEDKPKKLIPNNEENYILFMNGSIEVEIHKEANVLVLHEIYVNKDAPRGAASVAFDAVFNYLADVKYAALSASYGNYPIYKEQGDDEKYVWAKDPYAKDHWDFKPVSQSKFANKKSDKEKYREYVYAKRVQLLMIRVKQQPKT
jgi:hypothetical protein